jgi:general secretion pathway protein C
MLSRLAAFVIWAAVAASIVFWAMRLWVKPTTVPAHATLVGMASGFDGNLSRLFGPDVDPSDPAAPVAQAAADPRFRLIGVVAPRSAAANAEGLAVIVLDDKPPRAYRVGAAVDGDIVLQSVHARGASLGPRGQPAQVALELPALPPPATGVPAFVGGMAAPVPLPPTVPARPVPPAPPVDTQQPGVALPDRLNETAPQDPPVYVPPTSAGRERQRL